MPTHTHLTHMLGRQKHEVLYCSAVPNKPYAITKATSSAFNSTRTEFHTGGERFQNASGVFVRGRFSKLNNAVYNKTDVPRAVAQFVAFAVDVMFAPIFTEFFVPSRLAGISCLVLFRSHIRIWLSLASKLFRYLVWPCRRGCPKCARPSRMGDVLSLLGEEK